MLHDPATDPRTCRAWRSGRTRASTPGTGLRTTGTSSTSARSGPRTSRSWSSSTSRSPPETVYQRYFANLGFDERTAHERLVRICFIDYDREIALVAEREHPRAGRSREIVGIGRLSQDVRDDDARGRGPGDRRVAGQGDRPELMRRLVEMAKAEGVATLGADMRADNAGMRRAAEKVGFTIFPGASEDMVRAEMRLA